MKLCKLGIENFRSIKEDEVEFGDFTFFVGKNNYGKSNYLKALDYLLSFSSKYSNVKQLQNAKEQPIIIEGYFEGAKTYTPQLKESKHQEAVEKLIDSDGFICLRLTISPDGSAETLLVDPDTDQTVNPTGRTTNYRKIFPEAIFIPATADTGEELQEKSTTALSKIKKEVMQQFFDSLSTQVESAFEPVDKFLHGADRSPELQSLETEFAEEMMGEFSTVKPSVRFTLPDSEIIGKGMKIDLHDGFHECEIEEKGHGLQRTALFALMRLLSKSKAKDTTKPPPIFLIEELEAFLHPSAQQRLAESMETMSKKYQTITTTHSPFVLSSELLPGYRKVVRMESEGSKCICPPKTLSQSKEHDVVRNALAQSRNLISLFADNVVIVEGKEDSGFYPTIQKLFGLNYQKLTAFVESIEGGCGSLHVSYNFFKLMGFDNISVIGDLDCLFNTTFKPTLKVLGIDDSFIDELRTDIGHTGPGQPGLDDVLANIYKVDNTKLGRIIGELAQHRLYILTKGAPENYYTAAFIAAHSQNVKTIWKFLLSIGELQGTDELQAIMKSAIK